MALSKFIVIRKDLDLDEVLLEGEGLTIGRNPQSDVYLNHRSVSRLHAGISVINEEYWIFNLSKLNGTVLNGELCDKVPLIDGDVLQIGSYLLRASFREACPRCSADLSASVEQEQAPADCPVCGRVRKEGSLFCVDCGFDFSGRIAETCRECGTKREKGGRFCVQCGRDLQLRLLSQDQCPSCGLQVPEKRISTLCLTVELGIATKTLSADDAASGTVLFGIRTVVGKKVKTREGTVRGKGATALLTSYLPPSQDQALQIFWAKRMREEGKLGRRLEFSPREDQKFGKFQYNWRSTGDLKRLWRKGFMAWGSIVSGTFSILFLVFLPGAFSPDAGSTSHAKKTVERSSIAIRPNANSCFTCHTLRPMQQNCTSCHTTAQFTATISKAHMKEEIGCIGCHGEHQGAAFRPGIVATSTCISCHNDTFIYDGEPLGTPHGGTVGYPVENRVWKWAGVTPERWKARGLPGIPSRYSKIAQFHILHVHFGQIVNGKEITTRCADCHVTGNQQSAVFREAPRASCTACHSTSGFSENRMQAGPLCASCHEQHGTYKELKASPRKWMEPVQVNVRNIPVLGQGGARIIRQQGGTQGLRSYLRNAGALPAFGWLQLFGIIFIFGFVFAVADTFRKRKQLETASTSAPPVVESKPTTGSLNLAKIAAEGPKYPYPVVDPLLCIGCHACVEACPHDVLAMVNGISTPVAPDQCMEDTSCTIECPTQPKACVVLNTTKVIPPRKVPQRDQRYLTNVPGVYIIGDVAGVPLIKMAINEGVKVMDYIEADLKTEAPNPTAEYDIAVVGVGPGGLSTAALAKQKGLKYVAIEQEKVFATIQAYPAGKYVFFKPDSVQSAGSVPLGGAGELKENIVDSWLKLIQRQGLRIHEEESCKSIQKENEIFKITTERGKGLQSTYTTRKVVIAVGNRGAPMKLAVPGEDLTICIPAYVPRGKTCAICGTPYKAGERICQKCGAKIEGQQRPAVASSCPNCGVSFDKSQALRMTIRANSIAYSCQNCNYNVQEVPTVDTFDTKVKYKLSNPDDYQNKKCIVVGGGNSAIEAAVDLSGFKRDGNSITFTRTNDVTLIVRSDFKGDLKLGNKMNIYDCMDAGKVKVLFGAAIQEVREKEVVIINVRTKKEIETVPNDYIFALIGSERPTKFLESIGIKIPK